MVPPLSSLRGFFSPQSFVTSATTEVRFVAALGRQPEALAFDGISRMKVVSMLEESKEKYR